MHPIIFIEEKIFASYKSPLFELFSSEIQEVIPVASSFLMYNSTVFPIFTSLTPFIAKFIEEKKIEKYGVIIDCQDIYKINDIDKLTKASFLYVIGDIEEKYDSFFKKIGAKSFSRITMQGTVSNEKYIVCEQPCIADLYEDIVAQKILLEQDDKIYILFHCDDETKNFKNPFEIFNVEIEYICPNPSLFSFIFTNHRNIYYTSKLFDSYLKTKNTNSISVKNFIDLLIDDLNSHNIKECHKNKIINIICFKPTYLFEDLVERFKCVGCIHSDFPLADADAYIWMRPQELWHYEYLFRGVSNSEIKQSYIQAFNDLKDKCDFSEIQGKSIAIHHGTCFEPLYQFCSVKLAQSLYNITKVVGVCEFEECYGPSASIANRENFVFFPIGYDDTIFVESIIKREDRHSESILKIGIVGRAYGTSNKENLAKSILGEPYGYRKGADLIFDMALRLKTLKIPFELHILGSNWEELVTDLKKYGVHVIYYTRDKNITYKEFPSVYTNFDVLFIAARCEGGPVSVLEAMSLGIPVVSSNVGICRFLAKNIAVENAISCFDYDRKWGLFDKEKALELLLNRYNENFSFKNRITIRDSIKDYTTDAWVKYVFNEAEKLI